ncbi:uncharacterized protein LOC109713438 [Ananas comosus]|uniref:Uncharacterized protein LOC109713438 n=1 Tax=Ananas comosus TaxID=4615 RepID=A0A6P5FBZ0_ANACO|nr:uncharacterized protein LOC109713438 [Ananas comosus]
MVLWEITAITAYFLGLRRTYRLALRIQRRLIGPSHPRIGHFLQRRTRAVFDVALKVHKNIQQRDIAVGRNLGNSILRWLDRLKPSAQIRPHPSSTPTNGSFSSRNVSAHNQSLKMQKPNTKAAKDQESSSQLHFTSWNVRPKSFPTIAMMTQPARPSGMNSQYRRFSFLPSYGSYCSVSERRRDLLAGVFRKDIAQLMLQ